MNKLKSIFVALLLGLLIVPTAYAAEPKQKNNFDAEMWWGASSVHPTGVVRYNPEKASNGYNVIGNRLVDMNGNLKHQWEIGGKVYPNGEIIGANGRWVGGQQDSLDMEIRDFNSNITWMFNKVEEVLTRDKKGTMWISRQHHDYKREDYPSGYGIQNAAKKDNPNMLILSHRNLYDKRIHKTEQLLDDLILEVNQAGEIIWSWSPLDHLNDFKLTKAAKKALQAFPPADIPVLSRHAVNLETHPGGGFDWCHINTVAYVGPNKWYDAGDTRFHPDNILFNSRELCFTGIIDKKTGKIVWSIGTPYSDELLEKLDGHIIGSHGAHIIPRGYPGEGNILVFDNGGQAGYGEPNEFSKTGAYNLRRYHSRVLEINPTTFEVVWEYNYRKVNQSLEGHFEWRFFSPFVSYVQRMPNGNTLITVGDAMRVIEVTPDYENVWEYINPYAAARGPSMIGGVRRIDYNWIPQIKKPAEVPVTPKANHTNYLPNDKGQMPSINKIVK